jgi:hypothetical protein
MVPIVPARGACPSYRPGHSVHPIQARHAWRATDPPARPRVEDIAVEDSGLLTLRMADGFLEQRWHHDPATVRALLAEPSARRHTIVLAEPALMLIAAVAVSVCKVDAIVRCPTDTDVGALSLEERLEQLGGFNVAGRDVMDGRTADD